MKEMKTKSKKQKNQTIKIDELIILCGSDELKNLGHIKAMNGQIY